MFMSNGFTWHKHEWDEEGHEGHESSHSQYNECWRAEEGEVKHAGKDAGEGGGAALAAASFILFFNDITHRWQLSH